MGTPALHSRAAAACKLNNGVFRAPIQKAALPSEFSPADLSFGIGIAAIRVFTRLHASSRLRRNSLRASTRGHATACVRHTRPRSWHMPEPRVASLCSRIIPYLQSARHIIMPRGTKKKKKKRKILVRRNGLSTVQIHPQGLYGLASKLSFLNFSCFLCKFIN
jgi:hypothetical protein